MGVYGEGSREPAACIWHGRNELFAMKKRETAMIAEPKNYMKARELTAYLRAKGVDVVLVTKHAVQVHPDHIGAAEAAIKAYDKDWRGDGRYEDGRDES